MALVSCEVSIGVQRGSGALSMQLPHPAPISRASSRSSLARPNICRFTSLRRVIYPSIWPFDHGLTSAAATAALSLDRPLAKDARRLQAAVSIQVSRSDGLRSRIMVWKSDRSEPASASVGTAASIVATITASALLKPSRPVVISRARRRAEGTFS